jgi:hypothetical protein
MPTEITITAYKYSELEGRAKDRAREKLTEWATSYEWYDSTIDDAKERGNEKGFDIEDIQFSGFSSQGDGACWTGRVDIHAFITANLNPEGAWYGEDIILLELIDNGWVDRYVSIHNNSYRYTHSGGMLLYEYANNALDSLDDDDNAVLDHGVMQGASVVQLRNSFDYDQRINEWCDEALSQAKDYADEVFKLLRDEYEGITSDESLSEHADANEYLFDKEGRMV